MKKVLLFLIVITTVLFSCGSSDDDNQSEVSYLFQDMELMDEHLFDYDVPVDLVSPDKMPKFIIQMMISEDYSSKHVIQRNESNRKKMDAVWRGEYEGKTIYLIHSLLSYSSRLLNIYLSDGTAFYPDEEMETLLSPKHQWVRIY